MMQAQATEVKGDDDEEEGEEGEVSGASFT